MGVTGFGLTSDIGVTGGVSSVSLVQKVMNDFSQNC